MCVGECNCSSTEFKEAFDSRYPPDCFVLEFLFSFFFFLFEKQIDLEFEV